MPWPWLAVSAAFFSTPFQGVPASPPGQIKQTYGDLVVQASAASFTEEQVTFRQGVKAIYGQETLTADSLTLFPKEKKGEASGHVVLLDPAGSLSADNLSFSWADDKKGGQAQNLHLDVAGVMINAQSGQSIPAANLKNPPTLELKNVDGTSCGKEKTPLYTIRSPEVIFRPGNEGIIRHPTVYLYGHRIVTLPTQHFTLNPRIHGIPLPGIALSKNKVGIIWAPSVLIDSNTALSASIRSFKGEHFIADAYVSRTYLAPQNVNSLIIPHSDLSERFGGSYFDNVRVVGPMKGQSSLWAKRKTLAIGTTWNRASINDPADDEYSKLFDAVYELGGPFGRFGYQAQLHAEDMRINNEPFHPRLTGQGAIGPNPIKLMNNLFLAPRLDAAEFLGTTDFGWTRGEAGVYATPKPWLTFGVGYAHAVEFGKAMYPADRLLIRNEGMARLDYNLGPRSFSILFERDYDRNRWYRQYMASQVVGCLEVFVLSQQFPRNYQLGVTLRIDEFLNILRSRKLELQPTQQPSGSLAPSSTHAIHP